MTCILELSAGTGGGGGGGGDDDAGGGGEANSPQNAAEAALQDVLEQFRDQVFNLDDITGLLDEVGPYQNVFLQECERLNTLLAVMTQSLTELDLGFRGELTMSEAMEAVQTSLFMDRVPDVWVRVAFPSQRTLSLWTVNLQQRLTQMADWAAAPSEIPISTWISGLFNPQSFLTAIIRSRRMRRRWSWTNW
jgi:dynein heavy chain